jgi:hypothetical protein
MIENSKNDIYTVRCKNKTFYKEDINQKTEERFIKSQMKTMSDVFDLTASHVPH